ncbi:MAG: DUF815 domain-containing protein [Advenella sp.]
MTPAALQWALQHGTRAGRVAHQFTRAWVGQRMTDGLD